MRRISFIALLVVGCAAKEPAKSAADAESQVAKAEPQAATTAEPRQEAARAAPSKQEAAAPSGAPSADDVRDVLQAVIDDEALTPYLHLEQPNRFPLRVSGVPQNLQLTKAT